MAKKKISNKKPVVKKTYIKNFEGDRFLLTTQTLRDTYGDADYEETRILKLSDLRKAINAHDIIHVQYRQRWMVDKKWEPWKRYSLPFAVEFLEGDLRIGCQLFKGINAKKILQAAGVKGEEFTEIAQAIKALKECGE